MSRPLRIALVAPVATAIGPAALGSVQQLISLLVNGLVRHGHDVTLFATGDSRTTARLHAVFAQGYWHDPDMVTWELCELLNLAAAMEHASGFDLIHCHAIHYPLSLAFARTSPVPLVHTIHYSPSPEEVALWARCPDATFTAVSQDQARILKGVRVAGVAQHGIDVSSFRFREHPDDYLLFLGRFTEGKGPLQAIEAARRADRRLILAAPENAYFQDAIAPHVDGDQIVYAGAVDHPGRTALYGGARALLYPVQAPEPFGLVLLEAMACGTPVAALDRGAVAEVVDEGVTGYVFPTLDALVAGLPRVYGLDRHAVRRRALERFTDARMVDDYLRLYRDVLEAS